MTYKAKEALLKQVMTRTLEQKKFKLNRFPLSLVIQNSFRIHLIHLSGWGGALLKKVMTQKANGGGPEQVMTKHRILQ